MTNYRNLEDSYDDIKGATLDTLERNKNRYELPIHQAIAYFMNEMEGIFEENEFEKTVTLIPVGIFIVENKHFDCDLINHVKESISIIETNKYEDLFYCDEDKKQILEDVKVIKEHLNK